MSKYRFLGMPQEKVTPIFEYLEEHPDSESKDIRMHLGIKPDSYEHMSLLNTLRHLYNAGLLKRDGIEQHYRYSLNEASLVQSITGEKFRNISDALEKGNLDPEALKKLGLTHKKYPKLHKS
jgi:hypothetical protein